MCKEKGIYILSLIFSVSFLNFLPLAFYSPHTLECKLTGSQFGTYAFVKNDAVCKL